MDRPEESIDRLFSDHHGASLQTDATACPDPEEDWVDRPSMAQQLDDLMEKDGKGGHPHPMGDGQDWAHLEHGVPRDETKRAQALVLMTDLSNAILWAMDITVP